MKKEDKVSIIVPVYNVQSYLLRCLNSLKRQYYKNIEIIIIDDGSTDESGKICDEFAKKEKRATVFHKKNGGLSDARNYGLAKSKGKLIAFVDSDDYVEDDYVDKLVNALKRDESDIAVCGYDRMRPKNEVVSGFEATRYCLIRQNNIDIVAWNKLYKKELFDDNKVLFPKGEKHEDLLTMYKIISRANKVSYLGDTLYHYEERDGSITKSEDNIEKLKARERAAREAINYFSEDEELVAVARVSLLLAKYAYIDAALSGKIGEKYYKENREWIKEQADDYNRNKFLTKKLKIYNNMNLVCNGSFYRLYRRVCHD